MGNNEQVQDENLEQTTATDAEQVEETQGDEDSKDWKAEALKYKAIAERKDKKLQATEEKSEEPLKTKADQGSLTREEAIFFAKGHSEEDFEVASKIAKLEGISILAAVEDPYFKAKQEARKKEAQIKANQIGVSKGGSIKGHEEKPVSKMTREEHIEWTKKKIAGLNG
jgi:hypothetical protein